jgi:glycine cleavage system T protein (aminomethyltransferase)
VKKTKFYNIHEKLGAKIVEFAGYLMPIQYSSIIAEHKAVRNSVGVFDVSHMGEIFVTGENALNFVQHITINDASKLFPGRVQYSAICYPDAGIIDDLLVYKIADDKYMLVVNASNIQKDFDWMKQNNKFNVDLENLSDEYSLLAVQGPSSQKVIKKVFKEYFNDLEYYYFKEIAFDGSKLLISRTGYTGELGYEIYFAGTEPYAEQIWNLLFEAGEEFDIKPIGLGARDSLRLEMGYCLYGNDIDETINPLEANLGWITKLKKDGFIGKDALLRIKESGLKKKLVPIISEEKAFPRHGYEITTSGKKIGEVTSGTVSPVLEKAIALGYVESEFSSEGTELNFLIRGKEIPAKIGKLPFISKS